MLFTAAKYLRIRELVEFIFTLACPQLSYICYDVAQKADEFRTSFFL